MSILIRRRVLWDHLRSALWVMPTASVVFFLVAGMVVVPCVDRRRFAHTMAGIPGYTRRRPPNVHCGVVHDDPYTAAQAVHHLSEVLCVLARRRLDDRLYRDDHGTVRVAIPFPDFVGLCMAQ